MTSTIWALFGVQRLTLALADPVNNLLAVMEEDGDLRRRILLAPEGYSVAGPEGAYIFHALSAHPDVLDASAIETSQPGEVRVTVLSRVGNGAATAALVDIVGNYLSDETRRPLADFVTVQSAAIIDYAIEAAITTFAGPDSTIVHPHNRRPRRRARPRGRPTGVLTRSRRKYSVVVKPVA